MKMLTDTTGCQVPATAHRCTLGAGSTTPAGSLAAHRTIRHGYLAVFGAVASGEMAATAVALTAVALTAVAHTAVAHTAVAHTVSAWCDKATKFVPNNHSQRARPT